MNEISLPIEGVKAQSGRALNLNKVTQWHFSYKFFPENAWEEKGDDNFDVVISSFRLED